MGDQIVFREAEELTGPNEADTSGVMAIRLLAFEDGAAPPPYTSGIPGVHEGFVFVKVKLRLHNLGDRPEPQSGLGYTLIDSQGNTYAALDARMYDPVISCCGSGYEGDTMQPGDKATGYIAFNVPRHIRPARFRAAAEAGGTSAVTWVVK